MCCTTILDFQVSHNDSSHHPTRAIHQHPTRDNTRNHETKQPHVTSLCKLPEFQTRPSVNLKPVHKIKIKHVAGAEEAGNSPRPCNKKWKPTSISGMMWTRPVRKKNIIQKVNKFHVHHQKNLCNACIWLPVGSLHLTNNFYHRHARSRCDASKFKTPR